MAPFIKRVRKERRLAAKLHSCACHPMHRRSQEASKKEIDLSENRSSAGELYFAILAWRSSIALKQRYVTTSAVRSSAVAWFRRQAKTSFFTSVLFGVYMAAPPWESYLPTVEPTRRTNSTLELNVGKQTVDN